MNENNYSNYIQRMITERGAFIKNLEKYKYENEIDKWLKEFKTDLKD